LILFADGRNPGGPWPEDARRMLQAFALHWLLFVGDDEKAAWHAFSVGEVPQGSLKDLVRKYGEEGIARFVPQAGELARIRRRVEAAENPHELRRWAERFAGADEDGGRKPGEALRVLSTNAELIRRALMWVQRDYIAEECPDYDPTSGRDEDL